MRATKKLKPKEKRRDVMRLLGESVAQQPHKAANLPVYQIQRFPAFSSLTQNTL